MTHPTVNRNTLRQVYNWRDFALPVLLGARCRLCNARSLGPLELCAACLGDLPWLGPACSRCARPLERPALCGRCLRRPPPFDGIVAPFRYTGVITDLIRRFKFQGELAAGRLLADLLRLYLHDTGPAAPPDAVVPMPLHPARLRERGFNQAREIAARLNWPVADRLAARRRNTAEQSHLNAVQRRRNVRGAFAVDRERIHTRVAIVDDVVTTGTTVAELARALKRCGAERVMVLAVARA